MGELYYEPEPQVPVVHDYFGPAFDAWTRLWWSRHGGFIAFGWLFLFYLFWIGFKLTVWVGGVILLFAGCALLAIRDLCTYRRRQRQVHAAYVALIERMRETA